ncbi:MAG: PD-(D/E)XK nuclease family transposase [Acutalibacteraceae bacterium]|nr:PD-(D/E)XK nuclease family transposase [Acutalibacteraceae bacterium]
MQKPKTYEQEHAEDLERIRNFCLMDDEFMSAVLSDNPRAIELVLQIILESPTLKVAYSHTQESIHNLFGKDVILDVFCTDIRGTTFNVEIQRSDQGAVPKRARYHASMIDSRILAPGQSYQDLPESYIIFITENDYFSQSRPLYHIERTGRETGLPFEDFQHIIYVNGQYKSDDPLGRLIHDFWCKNTNNMNFQVLRDSVSYYKDVKEGNLAMCRALEEMRNETRTETRKQTLEEVAKALLLDGMPLSKISSILNIPEEEVKDLCEA